jgi:hypothetical protein
MLSSTYSEMPRLVHTNWNLDHRSAPELPTRDRRCVGEMAIYLPIFFSQHLSYEKLISPHLLVYSQRQENSLRLVVSSGAHFRLSKGFNVEVGLCLRIFVPFGSWERFRRFGNIY